MPATIDVLSTVYTAFWTVLNNYANFASTFKTGNQIRYDDGGNVLRPRKLSAMVADYPQIELQQGDFNTTMFHTDGSESLDMEETGFSGSFVEKWQIVLIATIITPQQQYTTAAPASPALSTGANYNNAVFMAALREAGPKLGLPYVTSFGPMVAKRTDGVVSTGNVALVTQDEIRLTINCTFNGNAGQLIVP